VAVKYFESDFVEKQYITVYKETLISFNNKQQWPIGKWTKSDFVLWEMLNKLFVRSYFQQKELLIYYFLISVA
jgi:hypothetical protein